MEYNLALQWTLDETADKCLKIGRDLMRLATEDRVQPIALLACEQFGNTIAICPMTRTKIHALIKSTSSPVFVKFLKAKVGFMAGGSLDYLSTNVAGLNFLSLAAALTSSTSNFEAASALEKMLLATSVDQTLMPDAYHIKDLLDVLEPRLSRAGFTNELVGWKLWWIKNDQVSDGFKTNLHWPYDMIPSLDGLSQVVSSLREICRIGEADKVTFTAGAGAPWLTAFIKWCLGMEPTIYHQNGQRLLEQPASPATIIFSENESFRAEMHIHISSTFSSFSKIITASLVTGESDRRHLGAGMISVQLHGQNALIMHGLDTGLGNRALLQALPFALKEVRDRSELGYPYEEPPSGAGRAYKANALPSENIIADVMAVYLSLPERISLEELPAGARVMDQPLVQLCLELEASINTRPMSGFMTKLSEITADILALSLFHGSLQSLLICHKPERRQNREHNFADRISENLGVVPGGYSFDIREILVWALNLVNHKVIELVKSGTWVASSFRGQVVFPQIFEAESLRRQGYLELACIQGTLITGRCSKKQLSLVTASEASVPPISDYADPDHGDLEERPSITGSLDMDSKADLHWKVSEEQDRVTVAMKWDHGVYESNPFDVLRALEYAYFLECCPHKPDTSLWTSFEENGLSTEVVTSLSEARIQHRYICTYNRLSVYPVGGNERLQMIALSSIMYHDPGPSIIMINNNACLSCLLAYLGRPYSGILIL